MSTVDSKFEHLVRPHFGALYRAAYRLTRVPEDAEDLMQEVCLRACGELGRLAALEDVLGWLLRVQYRLFVDGLRRRRRSPVWLAADGGELVERAVSAAPGPDDELVGERMHEQLTKAWSRLNRAQRALLALHAEGYSLGELERITGIKRTTLSVRLHRGRARLAKLLKCDETACVTSGAL